MLLKKATREALCKISLKEADYLVSKLGKILQSNIFFHGWNKQAIQKNYEKCWEVLSQLDD